MVLEASKSILDRIREMTGLIKDGDNLIQKAFNVSRPYIFISNNLFETETEKSEYRGFAYLLRGIIAYLRNSTTHELKIKKPINEEETIDIIALISFCHKIFGKCEVVRKEI